MEDKLSAIAQEERSSTGAGGAAVVSPLKVFVLTMGCAKNEVDSSRMVEKLLAAGASIIDDAAKADCIIVNTCSFIQAATEESIDAIFDLYGLPRVAAGKAKLIVAGCMPSRYGEELEESLPEVECFVPCSAEDDIVSVVGRLFPGRLGGAQLFIPMSEPSVYVKISDGCDRFCSFCTIPFIRGRYHSYSYEEIYQEVSAHVAAGAAEIVLIAQDTGRWGQDFSEPSSLAQLLKRLAESFSETWFRVMYIQPEGVSDELLDVIAEHDNIASYLDIPLQHANPRLIAAMNRVGSGEAFLNLVNKIRSRIPGVTLRTTLIAGFPGEEDEDFEELCQFVEDAEFDYVGVFAYSQEEGTRAAKLAEQVDEEVKAERAQTLRDIADSLSSARVAERIGQAIDVLVLGREEDGQLYGRAMCQAPDVDGVVFLSTGDIGGVVRVTIADTLLYDMEAE